MQNEACLAPSKETLLAEWNHNLIFLFQGYQNPFIFKSGDLTWHHSYYQGI